MIRFDAVVKSYPKEFGAPPRPAVDQVSFALPRGRTLGLIGANGAGKSTCIRLLLDFIRPDRGTISVLNAPPHRHLTRRHIGYLPETASSPANLTLMDMLRFTGATCAIPRATLRRRSEKWLQLLELWEVRKRPLRAYSKGMQQRANFAIALINDPELLILDEPMSGLDPLGREQIISLIADLKRQGKTILFCSHILDDVDRLADSVLVLHKGKALFQGEHAKLCAAQHQHKLVDAYLHLVKKEEGHA